jgi:hypothetical protein
MFKCWGWRINSAAYCARIKNILQNYVQYQPQDFFNIFVRCHKSISITKLLGMVDIRNNFLGGESLVEDGPNDPASLFPCLELHYAPCTTAAHVVGSLLVP